MPTSVNNTCNLSPIKIKDQIPINSLLFIQVYLRSPHQLSEVKLSYSFDEIKHFYPARILGWDTKLGIRLHRI